MTSIRLTLAILLLAGIASAATTTYERIDTGDVMNRADSYQGRLVEVSGNVCAVNADGKSIRLFDANTRVLIDVRLSQLSKAQRNAVLQSPVRHILVQGRAETRGGHLVIEAHQITLGE